MKENNPQDILKDILLRMRYDSSKTLSENKEIILEQGGYYYTPAGQLVRLPGTNNSNIPAKQIYPNITNNEYPQKADSNKMQGALAGRNIRNAIQQKPSGIPTVNRNPKYQELLRYYNLPSDLEYRKDAGFLIANRLVSGEYEEFKNKLKTINPEFYTKLFPPSPQVVQKPKPKVFPKVNTISYSDNARIAPGSFGRPPVGQLASDEQILNRERYESFMRRKKVDVGFDNEFEVPGTTNLYYWNENDHNDLTSFLNSFTFKDSSSDDWVEFFMLTGNKYQKKYVMPIGKVKGFTFKYKGVDLTFKRTATSDEFLNEFGTVIDGKYYKYVKSNFLGKTDWEDFGPALLNVGSIVLALFPATWPLLLASAGMDLYAAKMLYEQGETEGAKISVLLALTPFIGKLGIKVSPLASKNLINKFANAVTSDDVNKVVLNLSKEELSTLKSLRELGNLKSEVKTLAASKEVTDAINSAAKKAPGLGKTAIKKGALELSLAGSVLYTQWDNLKEEILAGMTNKELLNQLILATASMVDNETQKKEFDNLSKQVDTVVMSQVVSDLKKLIAEAKQTIKDDENKKLKEADKDINDVLNFILQENPENKIGEDSVKIISNINNIGKILLK